MPQINIDQKTCLTNLQIEGLSLQQKTYRMNHLAISMQILSQMKEVVSKPFANDKAEAKALALCFKVLDDLCVELNVELPPKKSKML